MTILRAGTNLARQIFEQELRANGDDFEWRKRLVAKPVRTQGSLVAQVYQRKDPVEEAPLDYDDEAIFDVPGEGEDPATIRIWMKGKPRSEKMWEVLARIEGYAEVQTFLSHAVDEGDVLLSGGKCWEVLTVNVPTLGVAKELTLKKR